MLTDVQGQPIETARLIYLVVLLSIVFLSAGGALLAQPGRTIRHALVWLLVFFGAALAYSFRGELGFARDRVVGEAVPAKGVADEKARSVTLYSQGGHFFVNADVEGKDVLFLIDTGSSDVTLSRADADRLGITPNERDFTRLYATANGVSKGAPITLDSIAIGPIDLRNVDASVAAGDLGVSLLGMTFLGRLKGYQVSGDSLVLRQ